MSGLFDTLSNIANFFSDAIELITSFFRVAVNGLTYLTGSVSYLPSYVRDYIFLFIGISIVLLVINRG